MSNFTPTVPFATDYDGDNITMKLKRLKKKDFLKVLPHIKGERGDDGTIIMEFEDQLELLSLTDNLLPKYVSSFFGLVTADGDPILLEDVVSEGYFIPLSSKLLGELFRISSPSIGKEGDPKDKGEAGNLKGQEQESSVDLHSEVQGTY